MRFTLTPSGRALGLGLVVAIALALTGCGGPPRGGPEGDRARLKPVPPLAGQDTFFEGKLLVELNVSAFGFSGRDPKGAPSGPDGGGRRGGGSGVGLSGGFGPIQGGIGGGGPGGGGPGGGRGGPPGMEGSTGGAIDPEQYRVQNIQRGVSRRPPVMIHVRVTNHGETPATVRILDFLSRLGNFVVLPEKLEIAPGQSVETEPMASQLGGEFSEVEVTLVIHSAGKREKKTIILRPDPNAPAADAPQPPPGK